eukprot:8985188-Alexandrium_andersonii.AAC.1
MCIRDRSFRAGLVAWGCRLLPVGETRRGRFSRASLDVVAAPANEAWKWAVTLSAGGPLSDHSVLLAGIDSGG